MNDRLFLACGRTTIRYSAPRAGHVRIDVYNVGGKRVRSLVDREVDAGQRTVTWDGRDARGRLVAPGVYLIRLAAGRDVETLRSVVVR